MQRWANSILSKLEDVLKAEGAAKKALEFDATNADAQLLLEDLAYSRKHYIDAQKAYAAIVGRTGVLQERGRDSGPCSIR